MLLIITMIMFIIFGFVMYRDWVKDCLTVWKGDIEIGPGIIAIFIILFSTFMLSGYIRFHIFNMN